MVIFLSWPRVLGSIVHFPPSWPMAGCILQEDPLFKLSWYAHNGIWTLCTRSLRRCLGFPSWYSTVSAIMFGNTCQLIDTRPPFCIELGQMHLVYATGSYAAHLPPIPRCQSLLRSVSRPIESLVDCTDAYRIEHLVCASLNMSVFPRTRAHVVCSFRPLLHDRSVYRQA